MIFLLAICKVMIKFMYELIHCGSHDNMSRY